MEKSDFTDNSSDLGESGRSDSSIGSSIQSSAEVHFELNSFTLQDGLFTADKSGRMTEHQIQKVKGEIA